MSPPPTVHASAVLVGGAGILIRGPSGSGKSALVLGLIDAGDGSRLIADDRVVLDVQDGRLVASPPPALAGLLEVRGQGILRVPFVAAAAIGLVADLRPLADCPRMPTAAEARVEIAGVTVRRVFLAIGAVDGPVRLRTAARYAPELQEMRGSPQAEASCVAESIGQDSGFRRTGRGGHGAGGERLPQGEGAEVAKL